MKDEKLIEAISCGIVEIVTPTKDVNRYTCHSSCSMTYSGCVSCRLGIEEYKISTCPFCGSAIAGNASGISCPGIVHPTYRCGTIINVCTHRTATPRSITTVVIGDKCRGMNDEDVI